MLELHHAIDGGEQGVVRTAAHIPPGMDLGTALPDEDIANFKAEMDAAGASYTFTAYDGALHGFSNPNATANGQKYGLPLAYDAATDERSWADMRGFFASVLA